MVCRHASLKNQSMSQVKKVADTALKCSLKMLLSLREIRRFLFLFLFICGSFNDSFYSSDCRTT
jgi:hypothetical protein